MADGVLLTYDDGQGDPIIFALAEVDAPTGGRQRTTER